MSLTWCAVALCLRLTSVRLCSCRRRRWSVWLCVSHRDECAMKKKNNKRNKMKIGAMWTSSASCEFPGIVIVVFVVAVYFVFSSAASFRRVHANMHGWASVCCLFSSASLFFSCTSSMSFERPRSRAATLKCNKRDKCPNAKCEIIIANAHFSVVWWWWILHSVSVISASYICSYAC